MAAKNALIDREHILLKDRYLHFCEPASYRQLRAELEAKVTEWRWATDDMCSPEPHYKKLFPGGRWCKSRRSGDNGHGFDAGGEIRIIDVSFAEHALLFDQRDDHLEATRFDRNGEAIYVSHYYFGDDGNVRRKLLLRYDGGVESIYVWERGRVTKRRDRCWSPTELLFHDEPWSGVIQDEYLVDVVFHYALDGEVSRIVRQDPDNNDEQLEILYQRKRANETVASVVKELEGYLVAQIPETLANTELSSPAYCLFVGYCSSGWDLPPMLIVATDETRQRVGPGLMWLVNELGEEWLELDDPAFVGRWKLLYQLMCEAEDLDAVVKLVRRVAKKLNKLELPLQTTTNFVVTAADTTDGIDIADDLRHSTTAAARKSLDLSGLA